MKCTNCGLEFNEPMNFCTACGAPASIDETACPNPAADRVLAVIKDGMFLAICILMSAVCALSIITGSLPVIEILLTVFLWITYAKGRKDIASDKHLRCVSGCVYANYVVTNVASIIIIVCGFVIALLLGILTTDADLFNSFTIEFGSMYPGLVPEALFSAIGWVLGLAFIVIGAIALIFNLLGMKKIHAFVKSVYQSVALQNAEYVNPKAVKNWLIFFGVCSTISALSSISSDFLAATAEGCSTAVIIIAVILINKYFIQAQDK